MSFPGFVTEVSKQKRRAPGQASQMAHYGGYMAHAVVGMCLEWAGGAVKGSGVIVFS